MQIKLITGACGFVGRHLVKRLKDISDEHILMIDDLSTGKEPEKWLNTAFKSKGKNIKFYGNRIIFIHFYLHSVCVLADFEIFINKCRDLFWDLPQSNDIIPGGDGQILHLLQESPMIISIIIWFDSVLR